MQVVSRFSGASCLQANFNWNAEILCAAKPTASGFTTVCTVQALTADEPNSIKTELKASPLNLFDDKKHHTYTGWGTVTYTGHERTLPSLGARIPCMIPVRKKRLQGKQQRAILWGLTGCSLSMYGKNTSKEVTPILTFWYRLASEDATVVLKTKKWQKTS